MQNSYFYKRRNVRRVFNQEIKYHQIYHNYMQNGWCLNISQSGALLKIDYKLKIMDSLVLYLIKDRESLNINCIVRYFRDNYEGYFIGVEFIHDNNSRDFIKSILIKIKKNQKLF